jgi:multidrug efflux pump
VESAQVSVITSYVGAAPEVVDTQITEVIESAVSGVDGVDTIRSVSSLGRSRTVVEFVPGRDVDQAANDIRDAVGRVIARLPDDADQPQVVKADSDSEPIMRLSMVSDRAGPEEITDYAERFVVDRLATIDGVAQVQIYGQRRYAMRIWLDRRALAARGLTVDDVDQALRRNNVELPAGRVQSATRELTVRTDTRLSTAQEFRDLVVRRVGDYPIRLGEVATVELGVADRETVVRADGRVAVGLGVLRQPQANTMAVSAAVREQLDALRPLLPEGMEIVVSADDAVFVRAAIGEVVHALALAMGLVVLVIFLFLGSLRATLVPAITIPVSVLGTFAVLQAFGFSINILTLLALILAIGLVVDDGIVVLENVQRRIEEGEPPRLAAELGAREVTFAVLATSAALIAVFLPLSFMDGQVGRLFREFGITLAAAVAISTLVALTSCVTLCAVVLRASPEARGSRALVARASRRVGRMYRRLLEGAVRAPVLVLGLAMACAGLGHLLLQALPRQLTPLEDRSRFFVSVTAPEGATAAYTDAQVALIEAVIERLRGTGELERLFANIGFGGQSHRAFVVATLRPWDQRERSQQEIVRSLTPDLAAVSGARVIAVNPQGLGLRGSAQPIQVVLGGPDIETVRGWAEAILEQAEANPGLTNLQLDYTPERPQLDVILDRRKADDLGVEIETVARTLQTMFASRDITRYVDRGREYDVIVQAADTDRRTPSDLTDIFVRTRGGDLVPLIALVDLSERATVPDLRRFDRLPSITLAGSLAEGYDLGRAVAFFQAVGRETLPADVRLAFDGQSREFVRTSGGVLSTFAIALLIVYLVLAAQFESFRHPLTVMLTVPLAVTGALGTLWLIGASLDIYGQIGLILLIGLTTKNGILIVEFANQLRERGRDLREAVLEAAVLRLRPILMTVIAMILGSLPLALASGAGAESRQPIGAVIVGGLAFASLLTLFVVPVLYEQLARLGAMREPIAQGTRAGGEARPVE